MKKKTIRNTLNASLKAEETALDEKFGKADGFFGSDSPEGAKSARKVDRVSHKGKEGRVVRDSFSFPESDHHLFLDIKKKAMRAGIEVNKSEIVRAGLNLLKSLPPSELKRALALIEKIKTGRPAENRNR